MKNNPAIMARHARVLKILTCLQSGPAFNARQLSDHLKVSRRTIFRDLSIIRDSGVGLFFDSITDAYRLHAGSQPDPPRLDEEDLTNLVVASLLSHWQYFPGITESIREATSKLLGGHSDQVKLRIARVLKGCRLERCENGFSSLKRDIIRALLQAIAQQKQLRILVDHEDLERWRAIAAEGTAAWTKLSPYELTVNGDDWSVSGRSTLHRSIRTFELDNILNVVFTSDDYEIPRNYRKQQEVSG
jgi:predicted DNA-binding transcriptional regulator YafY